MFLEETALESDELILQEHLKLLINEKDRVYFEGRKLDYFKNVLGEGQFKII